MIRPRKTGILFDAIVDPATALAYLVDLAKLEDRRQANQRAREIRKCVEILRASQAKTTGLHVRKYNLRDFVLYYEGMGECGHGTVCAMDDNSYTIQTFDYEGRAKSIKHVVTQSDMRGISSPEDAMNYFRIRSGESAKA